jgi:hypothetical protein
LHPEGSRRPARWCQPPPADIPATGAEPPPDAVVGSLLSAQLDALQQPIMDANLPGNLDGLLAHHLLGGRQLRCGWNLDR